jgi:hypothetical protein
MTCVSGADLDLNLPACADAGTALGPEARYLAPDRQ